METIQHVKTSIDYILIQLYFLYTDYTYTTVHSMAVSNHYHVEAKQLSCGPGLRVKSHGISQGKLFFNLIKSVNNIYDDTYMYIYLYIN